MPDNSILLDALREIAVESRTTSELQAIAQGALDNWEDALSVERLTAEKAEDERKARLVHTILISRDSAPINPRIEYDNVSTMACWHRRYILGDKGGPDKLLEAVRAAPEYKDEWENDHDLSSPGNLLKFAQQCSNIVMLPLYLYDHSAITMNTVDFGDRWDSGQVGVIFVTRELAEKEWGKGFVKYVGETNSHFDNGQYVIPLKEEEFVYVVRDNKGVSCNINKSNFEKVADEEVWRHYMKIDVEVYDQYLTGEVYGFRIFEHDKDESPESGEEGDSCWGFFGRDFKKNGMAEHWPEEWPFYTIKYEDE